MWGAIIFDTGTNYGVTGIINIGTTSQSQMVVTVRAFGAGLKAQTHNITGPGSNYSEKWYSSNVGGHGDWRGEAQPDLSPWPTTMHNLQGTLTLQYASTASTIAFPILVSTTDVTRNEKTQNVWIPSGSWIKNGPYVLNWNGTTSYSQPTLLLQELFSGSSISYDKNTLTTHATEVWFTPINGTTNAAETTAITTFSATAVPPVTSLKIDLVTIERLDDGAGILTVSWAYSDSLDRQLLPQAYTDVDPNGLISTAGSAGMDIAPSTISGYTLRHTRSRNPTPLHTVYDGYYGLRTTVEDHTFPGTFVWRDNQSLNSRGNAVLINNSSSSAPAFSTPSSLKILNTRVVQLTSTLGTANNYEWSRQFAMRDSVDQFTFPRTRSTGSAQKPFTDSFATVIDVGTNTGTTGIAYLRNLIWNASQSQAYILDVEVVPLTDNKAGVVFRYLNPGVYVKGKGSGKNSIRSRVNTSSGDIEVYLAQNSGYGTGRRLVLATPIESLDYGREILDYVLVRHLTGPTVPRQNPETIDGVTLPFYNQTNSDSFLGNGTGSTIYETLAFSAIINNATTSQIVGYNFHHDSNGIVRGEQYVTYGRQIVVNSTISSTGWVSAAGLGAPFNALYKPTQASFAAFTS